MNSHPPTSPAFVDTVDISWADQPIVYLVLAALALLFALRLMRRAMAPVGALVQAAVAAVAVAFAIGLAFVFVVAAAVSGT